MGQVCIEGFELLDGSTDMRVQRKRIVGDHADVLTREIGVEQKRADCADGGVGEVRGHPGDPVGFDEFDIVVENKDRGMTRSKDPEVDRSGEVPVTRWPAYHLDSRIGGERRLSRLAASSALLAARVLTPPL